MVEIYEINVKKLPNNCGECQFEVTHDLTPYKKCIATGEVMHDLYDVKRGHNCPMKEKNG